MAESLGHARGGPPPRLFPASAALASGDQRAPRRLSLSHPGEPRTWWFDSSSYPAEDGATLHFAIHANPLVRAEEALRNFVQTLTQTFAHLPIGLAIFDRQRQLALFNPALSDLTRLEPEWLTARPTLHAVLDRLRDRRMMPEPKDYRSWREQLADLERAARNGTYEEIWPLPTGQTYRITGRPHPEGAVAFLLEDISAEVSLKRRFRAELELSQSVIDSLDEAIAVFSPSGRLVLSNAAYAALWGHDPSTTLGEVGIADATRHWRELTRPTPVWGELRDFASQASARGEWTAEVALKDGSPLSCRFSPLARSATLCAFSRAAPAPRPEPARRPAAAALG
jgi:PAS domain-containing protein